MLDSLDVSNSKHMIPDSLNMDHCCKMDSNNFFHNIFKNPGELYRDHNLENSDSLHNIKEIQDLFYIYRNLDEKGFFNNIFPIQDLFCKNRMQDN